MEEAISIFRACDISFNGRYFMYSYSQVFSVIPGTQVKMVDGKADEGRTNDTAEHKVFEVNADSQKETTSRNDSQCPESLEKWLQKNALSAHFRKMFDCGITSVSHLEDVTEEDVVSDVRMTKFEARRLKRALKEWKETQGKKKKSAGSDCPRLCYKQSSCGRDFAASISRFCSHPRWREKCYRFFTNSKNKMAKVMV